MSKADSSTLESQAHIKADPYAVYPAIPATLETSQELVVSDSSWN